MSTLHVGVNLLWLAPGEVGGSEEYVCRLLEGVDELASRDVEITLFVNRRFWGAHPKLAERASVGGRSDIRPVEVGTDRGRVDVVGGPRREPGCRPGPPSWRHCPLAIAEASAPVAPRPAIPRPSRVLLVAEAQLPRCRRPEVDAAGRSRHRPQRVRSGHGDRRSSASRPSGCSWCRTASRALSPDGRRLPTSCGRAMGSRAPSPVPGGDLGSQEPRDRGAGPGRPAGESTPS